VLVRPLRRGAALYCRKHAPQPPRPTWLSVAHVDVGVDVKVELDVVLDVEVELELELDVVLDVDVDVDVEIISTAALGSE